ncbi:MAG: hypothetical protein M3277_03015 [Actinomycetota bacterium]|nr:hypothetical protein [Actinomycetota bacterium]
MKRSIAIVMALALSAVLTASATGAPKPNVVDPMNDANGVNDQGTGDGSFGDFNPATVSTVTDLLEIRFTNDAKSITAHIKTQAGPPASQGTGYRVRVNPGAGGVYCLYFESFHPGAGNDLTENVGHVRDACTGEVIEAVVIPTIHGLGITVPRDSHEAFGKGKKLVAPQGAGFVYAGSTYPAGVMYPVTDTTKPGTDYAIKK